MSLDIADITPERMAPADRVLVEFGGLDPKLYYGAPVEIDDLKAEGFAPELIPKHTILAPSLNDTRFLPYLGADVHKKAKASPALRICGRILDIEVETMPEGMPSQETISVVDGRWTNGDIWAKARVLQSERERRYDPLKGLTNAVAVFVYDPSAEHPLHDETRGDWQLVDVLTSWDANPHNGVATSVKRYAVDEASGAFLQDEDTGDLIEDPDGEPMARSFIMSDLAEPIETHIRAELVSDIEDPVKAEKVLNERIDDIMRALYSTFSVDGGGRAVYPGYDFDNDPEIDTKTKDQIHKFIEHAMQDGLMEWAVPFRGWQQMMGIQQYLDDYRAQYGGRLPKGMKAKLQAYQDNIRNEVIQGLAMTKLRQILLMGALQQRKPAEPVRWHIRGVDQFDRKFLKGLKRAQFPETPELEEEVTALAGEYDKYGKDARLVLEATQGNEMIASHDINGRGGKPIPKYLYSRGQDAPYDEAQLGARPAEIAASVYQGPRQLKMPGIVGRFDIKGPDMPFAQRVMVVDLMEAPAILLQEIMEGEGGYFENRTGLLHLDRNLSELLESDHPESSVIVVRTTAQKVGAEVLEILRENESAAVITDTKRQGTEIQSNKVHSRLELARVSGEQVARKDKRELRSTVDVAGKKLTPGQIALANVVLHRDTVHVHKRPGTGAQVLTMRSWGDLAQ